MDTMWTLWVLLRAAGACMRRSVEQAVQEVVEVLQPGPLGVSRLHMLVCGGGRGTGTD
jgi:hypothetical protein